MTLLLDYGQGFLGLSLGQCLYIVNDSRYGALVFGGDFDGTASNSSTIVVEPRDAVRRRVFIGDIGLKIEISAGAIETVQYSMATDEVVMDIVPAATSGALQATNATIWLKQPASGNLGFKVNDSTKERGGWAFSLGRGSTRVVIVRAS